MGIYIVNIFWIQTGVFQCSADRARGAISVRQRNIHGVGTQTVSDHLRVYLRATGFRIF